MTRRTSRTRPTTTTENGGVREVAVLADGPWAPRRYWRADLEAMQHASRARGYPDRHPCAVLRGYHRTDQHTDDGGPDTTTAPTAPMTRGVCSAPTPRLLIRRGDHAGRPRPSTGGAA